MSCPHCNYDSLSEGSRYCPNCGGGLPPAPRVVVSQDVGTVQKGAKLVGVEIGNWITTIVSPSEEQVLAGRQRERWDMLQRVESHWVQGILEPSLHGLGMMELGMEDCADADAVKRPWADLVQMPEEARQPLPRGATIRDAFDQSDLSLLLLGKPGAGKSTMLLELARQTIDRARLDPLQPIPVVFHLASWAQEQRPVEQWLVQELRTRYDRRRKVAESWVADDELLLLLDGLDEVHAGAREECVQALNAFRAEHPVPMVVCCRVDEWQALGTRLRLGGAVLLHPLTPEQVDGYLQREGQDLEAVRLALQRDPGLRELAETPLTLSVMTRAYRGASAEEMAALGTAEAQRQHLFERYIQHMFFKHGAPQHPYPLEQTVRWLGWLADGLREHGQIIFSLEGLQPSWLPTRLQRRLYTLASRTLTGLLMGLALWLFLVVIGSDASDSLVVLFPYAAAGLGVGLVDAVRFERNRPGQGSSTPGILRGRRFAAYVLLITVTATLSWSVPFALLYSMENPIDLFAGLVIGLPIAGFASLPFSLIWGLRLHGQSASTDVRTVKGLRWSWQGFLLPVLALGLIPAAITFTITSSRYEPGVRLWDGRTGAFIAPLEGHTDDVRSASFSPDGTRIVTRALEDNTARLWDGQTGDYIKTLEGHTGRVESASFSPDGTRIVTTAEYDHTARLWDGQTGGYIKTLEGHTDDIWWASFSPDGTRIVTTAVYDHIARLWDGQTGDHIKTLEGHTDDVWWASFSPDGARIVTASDDHTARLWDGQTGDCIKTLEGHTGRVESARFSPDGARIVTASDDHTARLWDGQTGDYIKTLEGHTSWINSASFSPDGMRIVTASDDHTARLWDGQTGDFIKTLGGHTSDVRSASFSPDGTRIVTRADEDPRARLWDGQTGDFIKTLKGHDWIDSVSFGPDGTRIVTIADEDITAQLWDGQTGDYIKTLEGHTRWISSASFSPDGTRIVTRAGGDNTVRLWNGQTGVPIAILEGHKDTVRSARFSPDGTRIVTAGDWTDARPLALLALLPGILLGLILGLRVPIQESKDSPDQAQQSMVSPNQGIRRSAASAALVGFAFGLVFALLVTAALVWMGASLLVAFMLLSVFAPVAILAGLAYGGLDVLFHYLLRFILAATRHTPWRYVPFLDYAVRRIFLRKLGGSYIFIHRLLRDHFAALYREESVQVPKE